MFDALRFDDKVAIITGGAGGIGAATAELMIGRGAKVVIADIAADQSIQVVERLGDGATAIPLDLKDEDNIKSFVATVADRFGRIDVLVNNATAAGPNFAARDGAIGEMETELWEATFHVNCRGAMIITRESMPYLIEAKGSIVNTVSGQGLQGHIRNTAYAATKAAIIQLTRSIATGYGRRGVRCNAVAPGLILTETVAREFPAAWRALIEEETLRDTSGSPDDIAEAIAFLASDAARNITGQTLVSDGGASIHIPGFKAYCEAFGHPL